MFKPWHLRFDGLCKLPTIPFRHTGTPASHRTLFGGLHRQAISRENHFTPRFPFDHDKENLTSPKIVRFSRNIFPRRKALLPFHPFPLPENPRKVFSNKQQGVLLACLHGCRHKYVSVRGFHIEMQVPNTLANQLDGHIAHAKRCHSARHGTPRRLRGPRADRKRTPSSPRPRPKHSRTLP